MNTTPVSDLHVTPLSDALFGRRIDVVVSGSIAAVESVRFIRALRRLGAQVTPWLTQGGAQFVQPMALEWAAAETCVQAFSGTATHICTSDAVIVAPGSSNTINKIAQGITDTPASALISSAVGQNKPVLILPAMHDSLAHAPSHIQNLKTLSEWKSVEILPSRLEEGKRKFPDPALLADESAHRLNQNKRPIDPVLITMGTTRGYIDDIRYVSNYSSGKLGSLISEELYRQGFRTQIVCGPCEYKPQTFTKCVSIKTHTEMLNACLESEKQGAHAGIFCASVIDFEPDQKLTGKIKSDQPSLSITMSPTEKIIGRIKLPGKIKIGFKLEANLNEDRALSIAKSYTTKYSLKALIANDLSLVSPMEHHAWCITDLGKMTELNSKRAIARHIAQILSN